MDDYIIDILLNQFVISEEQAEEVRWKAEEEGRDIIEVLEELNILTEDDVIQTLAAEYNMETFDLADYRIPDDVVKMIPSDIANQYKIVPVMYHEGTVTIAIPDPIKGMEIIDLLGHVIHAEIEAVVVKRAQIEKAVKGYYGTTDEAVNSVITEMTEGDIEIEIGKEEQESFDMGDDSPIIKLVALIITKAYKTRASDIHLEPLEKVFRIRNRIDGVLNEIDPPPKYLQNNILQRLKIMAKLDISEKRIPQDGRIMFKMPDKRIDLRVSTVPTVHGESIVMRILDKSSILLGIPELGFFHDDQELIDKIINMPDGIFLVTGPTGSGKTTSLYAFLNTLNTPNRKIITAEDPVEYELDGINQVQCDKERMTFPMALRAMLRQAPNIVMVGEIRDLSTGAVAINAALTGHLVFSTLHTNDAPTAITRLIDMGVKPFLVASGVRAVMAQRLVRRICKKCAQPVQPTDEELRVLELKKDYFAEANLVRGTGCDNCKLGYKGRMGLYEIFTVNDQIVQLIFRSAPLDEISDCARKNGMRVLRDDGLRKAAAGMTTLEEIIRITKVADEVEG